MRIILKKEVHNLGDAGDIVKVAAGYGRNFLIPNGFAVPATDGSVAQNEHQKKVADAIRRKELVTAKELATKLEQTAVTIRREAGEDEKLFGAVTNRDVAEALGAEGVKVDRKAIALADPIRAIGLFTVPVRLHREVSANVRVYVIRG
jgi:large subunit ribosomal protein L9